MAALDLGLGESDGVSVFGAAPVVAYACFGEADALVSLAAAQTFSVLCFAGSCPGGLFGVATTLSGHWILFGGLGAAFGGAGVLGGEWQLAGGGSPFASGAGSLTGQLTQLLALPVVAAIGAAAVLDDRPGLSGSSDGVLGFFWNPTLLFDLPLAGAAGGVLSAAASLDRRPSLSGSCSAASLAVIVQLYSPIALAGVMAAFDGWELPQLAGLAGGLFAAVPANVSGPVTVNLVSA